MSERIDIIDIFDNCIDRLHQGEALDAILQDYPREANRLRPMLEAGQISRKVTYPVAQVDGAFQAIQPTINQTINATFGSSGLGMWFGGILVLVAGALIVVVSQMGSTNPDIPNSTTVDPTVIQARDIQLEGQISALSSGQITVNNLTIDIIDASITGILQVNALVSVEGQISDEQIIASSVTVIATTQPDATSLSTVSATDAFTIADIIVVEGQVTDITDNVITLYGIDFTLPDNSPYQTALRLGDSVRIEGQSSETGDAITVINITVINATILVNDDGLAWRDDDCSNAPPPWVNRQETEWFNRCTSQQGNGTGDGSMSRS